MNANELGRCGVYCVVVKGAVLFLLLIAGGVHAESGYDAWLRYSPLKDRGALPRVVIAPGESLVLRSATQELIRGVRGMLGETLRLERAGSPEAALLVGTLADLHRAEPGVALPDSIPEDGYLLKTTTSRGVRRLVVTASNDRGVLYGVFALLRRIALGEQVGVLDVKQAPYAPVRWVNQWENLDGSIERGYGGKSIFYENNNVRADLSRVRDYGRLLASLGINGCAINNVNANPRTITTEFLPPVARIAEALRPWGVQVVLAVDFGSPKRAGNLEGFDPLDPRVAAWWKAKVDEIYAAVPDLAGFVMKADSEGRVGPSAYGRTHADAANTVARALKPHGGLMFYRAFVYDHNLDWRNLKNDRARAAYDNFHPLDGKFDDNVVIQIKNGPIDFQVREPASPLFGGLEKTNQAIELQITQEYFGQARHLVFLAPMWKEALAGTPVKALVARKGGFVGVANVGLDESWMGNHMSQANLYAFGRLAWDPNLSARRIAEEWTRLTFGDDPKVIETVVGIQLRSWRVFENYTGPLGLQTLTAITGNHYGPAVEASERNGWGQWHRSDEHGTGMDRTVATGTGFIGQYRPTAARIYETTSACPDDLLLFMHHVPYTHVLHSGKTVIQTLYDFHYDGAAAVADYVRQWKSLQGRVDERRYGEVLAQLEYQAGHAEVWRDAISGWFRKTSGIPDAKGRVGHAPGRVEAESMRLDGYTVTKVTPWEGASGGKAIQCGSARCSASFRFDGTPGRHTIVIQYFDQNNGVSRYALWVNNQLIDEWRAADRLPSAKIDSSSSTRRVASGVALRPGDEIRIEGTPDGGELAALDYVEIRGITPASGSSANPRRKVSDSDPSRRVP